NCWAMTAPNSSSRLTPASSQSAWQRSRFSGVGRMRLGVCWGRHAIEEWESLLATQKEAGECHEPKHSLELSRILSNQPCRRVSLKTLGQRCYSRWAQEETHPQYPPFERLERPFPWVSTNGGTPEVNHLEPC